MTRARQALTLDCPTTYQIEVQGYLDENRAEWFDGMSLVPQVLAEDRTITTLTGRVVDQAALHGLLRKLYMLGLPLLSLKRIEPEQLTQNKVGQK
jgi:hypothetical protein